MRREVVVAGAAFAVMEPVAYAAHRWIMHGPGWILHDSHHRAGPVVEGPEGDAASGTGGGFEANDAFPLAFAATTIVAMAAGTLRAGRSGLVAATVGVTVYGAAYGFVHDVYIHRRHRRDRCDRRDRRDRRRPGGQLVIGPFEPLRRAHELHHRGGGEPYGMLWPIVPAGVRRGG